MSNTPQNTVLPVVSLRDYQWKSTAFLARAAGEGHRKLGLASPTGSGKTTIIQSFLGKTRPLYTGVVIAAPTEQIEETFYREALLAFDANYGPGHSSVIRFPIYKKMFTRPRSEDVHGRSEIYRLLSKAGHQRPFFLTTHRQLTVWGTDVLPADLAGKLLVLDEAHHAGTDSGSQHLNKVIGEFARIFHERGGSVLYVSAHPFRADDLSVFPEGTVSYTRDIATHSLGGVYAPSHFHSETVTVDLDMDTVKKLAGEVAPEDSELRTACEAMVDHWQSIGRPKAVFNVPSGTGDRATKFADTLMEIFAEHGETRIVNAVGDDVDVKNNFLAALARERAVQSYAESEVDVFIACRRFDEGTDWPLCSHVFNWGISSSLSLILQRWGRAMRLKKVYADYPNHFLDEAVMVFFVGKVSSDILAEYESQHKEHSLLLACTLADWETGIKYRSSFRIRAEKAWCRPPSSEEDEALQTADLQNLELGEAVRAKVMATLAKLEISLGRAPTLDEAFGSPFTKEELRALTYILTERLPNVVQEELLGSLTSRPKNLVRADLLAILREGLEKFKDLTVSVLDEVTLFYSRFTGLKASEVAEWLRSRLPNSLTLDLVRQALKSWLDARGSVESVRGRGPSPKGDASQHFGFSCAWGKVNGWLNKHHNTSLFRLMRELQGSKVRPRFSKETISKAMAKHYTRTGRIPNPTQNGKEDFGFPCKWLEPAKWLRTYRKQELIGLAVELGLVTFSTKIEKTSPPGSSSPVLPPHPIEPHGDLVPCWRELTPSELEARRKKIDSDTLLQRDGNSHWRKRIALLSSTYREDEEMLRELLKVEQTQIVKEAAVAALRDLYGKQGVLELPENQEYLDRFIPFREAEEKLVEALDGGLLETPEDKLRFVKYFRVLEADDRVGDILFQTRRRIWMKPFRDIFQGLSK